MNKTMKSVCKLSLDTIAKELIDIWALDPLLMNYLLKGKHESMLQEMLYEKRIGKDIEWLYQHIR
jgi:hypothetical protein